MKGNIQKRGPNSWRIRFDVPSNNQRKQVSETVRGTKRDAQRTLRERLASIDKGVYLEKTNESTSEYLNRWLETHSMNVSLRTIVGYTTCIKRLEKHFGEISLQKRSVCEP